MVRLKIEILIFRKEGIMEKFPMTVAHAYESVDDRSLS